jgi:hypothetical protein
VPSLGQAKNKLFLTFLLPFFESPKNIFLADPRRGNTFLRKKNTLESSTDSIVTGCCGGGGGGGRGEGEGGGSVGGNEDPGSGNVTTEGPESEDEGKNCYSRMRSVQTAEVLIDENVSRKRNFFCSRLDCIWVKRTLKVHFHGLTNPSYSPPYRPPYCTSRTNLSYICPGRRAARRV